jgi:hypothetical protein
MLQSRSYTCIETGIADCRKVAYVAKARILTVTGQQCILSMYILEHRSSCGTSRVRPSWPRSGCILTQLWPLLARMHLVATPDSMMLFIAVNDNGSSFTLKSSALWVASPLTYK